MRQALMLMLGVVAVAAICRAGLSWDGSYILFATLHEQQAFITHTRLTSHLMLWPVVWLSHLTTNMYVLAAAFTAIWGLVPVASLALCWRLLRTRAPELMVWPAIGICLVTLPGQFFFASESLAAAQLFWPVVLWICVGAPLRWSPVAAALTISVALLHPAGGGLLLTGALAFLAVASAGCSNFRTRVPLASGALVFAAAGALRIAAIEDTGYEGSSFSGTVLADHFRTAVLGAPLVIWGCLAVLAFALILGTRLAAADRIARKGLVVIAAVFVAWAVRAEWWAEGLNYRSWGAIVSAAWMLACVLDAVRRSRATATGEASRPIAADATTPTSSDETRPTRPLNATLIRGAAAIFAAVIVVQSVLWAVQLHRLSIAARSEAAACRLVTEATDQPERLASSHWAVRATSVLVQGRRPHTLLVEEQKICGQLSGDSVPIAPYESSKRDGWFDLQQIGRNTGR